MNNFALEGSRKTAKGLFFLYITLVILQILLFAVVHFLVQTEAIFVSKKIVIFFYYAVPFFSLGAVITAYILFCKRKQLAYKAISDSDMLELYKSASIMKYAAFELGSVFTLIAYYLTHHSPYILFYFIVLIIFIMNYPSNQRLLEDLDPDNPSNKGCGPSKEND